MDNAFTTDKHDSYNVIILRTFIYTSHSTDAISQISRHSSEKRSPLTVKYKH